MPLVLLSRKLDVVNDELAQKIARQLPAIVACALNTSPEDERGKLTPDDIKVYVQDSSPLDVNVKPLEITIWAGYYPAREKNLDERREEIIEAVRVIKPPEIKGWVWVLLNPGSFGEL